MFHATDYNNGVYPMHIGTIPAFDGTNPVVNQGMFMYSACHNHYHFNYYANFSWVDSTGVPAGDSQKRGFCLISYYRLVNSEWAPLTNPYGFCAFQGIASGWADIYSIGIPCQWKDITSVTTQQTGTLVAHANFADMLCEGLTICENDGITPRFVDTNLSTCAETPPSHCSTVQKFECQASSGTLADNTDQVPSFVGGAGKSYVTNSDPANALFTIGPLRDTEWQLASATQLLPCTAGAIKTLQCSISNVGTSHSREPQVIRVCESSRALQVGLACRYNESLANVVIDQVFPAYITVTFTCPAARDLVETGGAYSLYQNMVIITDGTPKITCVNPPVKRRALKTAKGVHE